MLGGTENVVLQLCQIFKPLVNNIVVCSCGGVNVEKLNDMGIKHYEIPDIENKDPKSVLNTFRLVRSIIKKENITVIHTHHRMAAFYVSKMRLDRKCLFINTCHNIFDNKKYLTVFSYKKANLIACGEMVKKNLTDFFNLPANSIKVIHNAVKPFENKIILDDTVRKFHEEGCFVIGNIGRLSPQKGMEYYLKAIPLVLKEHKNCRFLIVGSGEDEKKLKKLANESGIKEYVVFLGYREDIQNLMSQLDLIVLSSLWEGLPLTPIEAFSVGKTIVATAVDGTVEIIDNKVDGLLVEPADEEQIAQKINWLLEQPERKAIMEQNAQKKYDNGFSFSIFSDSYENYYRELKR